MHAIKNNMVRLVVQANATHALNIICKQNLIRINQTIIKKNNTIKHKNLGCYGYRKYHLLPQQQPQQTEGLAATTLLTVTKCERICYVTNYQALCCGLALEVRSRSLLAEQVQQTPLALEITFI